jgi:hypothetical protein
MKFLMDTFRRINIKSVFMCEHCKKCWLGKDLYKTRDEQYVCLDCNGAVKDVTDSPLGQSFIQIVRP